MSRGPSLLHHGALRTILLALMLTGLAASGRASSAASAIQPDETEALTAAEGLMRSGFYRQAVERLTVPARELSPAGDALLGRALALDRRYLAAEGPLRRAVDGGRRDLPTLFYLGSTLWENGKLDEAGDVFTAALEASEDHPAILHQLGRLELWRGNWTAAARLLERAAAKTSADLDLTLDRARALEGAGRAAEALAAYRTVVSRAPEHSGARYGLGRLLLTTGAKEEGGRELDIYRDLHRREQEATRVSGLQRAGLDRGLALLHAGDYLAAVDHLRTLVPTPDNLDALSRALDAAGRRAESLDALERAVALAPERRDLRDRLTENRLAAPATDG